MAPVAVEEPATVSQSPGSSPRPSPKPAGNKRKKISPVAVIASKAKTSKRNQTLEKHSVPAKRLKLTCQSLGSGLVLTLGQGDTGQLGLGEDVMEKSRPGLVAGIKDAVDVVAGGMHSVVLDKDGVIWTFGCNDEGSLGRAVEGEEDCFLPGKVLVDDRVVMVSAGDSHTAALTEGGEVFVWGTFRDSSGPIGLKEPHVIEKFPVRILEGEEVVKISSGSDHLAILTRGGDVWTMGNSEQGQLGRVGESFAHRGGRRGLGMLLQPGQIHWRDRKTVIKDVWAGSYNTLALTATGKVLVVGLNNYSQMGLAADRLTFFMPAVSASFGGGDSSVSSISLGQHHTLLLRGDGEVCVVGRSEYGRLGLGEDTTDVTEPTALATIGECRAVACGTSVSYAVTKAGALYSWGMGTNGQLGTGEEEDVWEPKLMKSKQLEGREVLAVSSGGQHTIILVRDSKTQ